jgi:hypothetical protein
MAQRTHHHGLPEIKRFQPFTGSSMMALDTDQHPNTQAIVDALGIIRPSGAILLVAICPKKQSPIQARSFLIPDEAHDAAAWSLKLNAQGMNLYFTVNVTGQSGKKASKDDMVQALACWADCDPNVFRYGNYDKARDYLLSNTVPALKGKATYCIDSGNGISPFFCLKEPIQIDADYAGYESINDLVGKAWAGGGTQNCDRVMRLPGTLNYPNNAKLSKGYPSEPRLARLLFSGGPTYDTAGLQRMVTRRNLDVKFQEFLYEHPAVASRYAGSRENLADPSGSAMDFSMVSMLKLGEFTKQETIEILETWPHGSSSTARGEPRYWERCWSRAASESIDAKPRQNSPLTQFVAPGGEKSPLFKAIEDWQPRTISDLVAEKPVSFYVEGLIQSHLAGVLVSQGGTGKTSVLMLLAIATATGGHWFGMRVTAGSFVLLSLDDAQEDLDGCFARILKTMPELSSGDFDNIRRRVRLISLRGIRDAIKFAAVDRAGYVSTGLDEALIQALAGVEDLRCVALDTLRQFAGGTTNDDQLVTISTKAITALCDGRQCAGIVNHHGTKQGARDGVVDQYSGAGSGALADNLRFVLNLAALPAEDARKRLALSPIESSALDHGSVILELTDTRGSLLRRTREPAYLIRQEFKFSLLNVARKTAAEAAMDKFKEVALLIEKNGPMSRNALFGKIKGKKQDFYALVAGWEGGGVLVPIGSGSTAAIGVTDAGKQAAGI